jgi:acyl carrier protein
MVLETLLELIAEQFQRDVEDLNEDTAFEDLGAEDMDIAELVLTVEDAFDMDISTDEANGLSTIADLLDLVEEAIGS